MRPKPAFAAWALALGALVAPAAHAAGLAGVWDVLTEGDGGQRRSVLTVSTDGETLSGYIQGERGEGPIEMIAVDGDRFSFVVEMDAAFGTIDLNYAGTVSGDSIEGSIETAFGSFSFSGTRRQGEGQEPDAAR